MTYGSNIICRALTLVCVASLTAACGAAAQAQEPVFTKVFSPGTQPQWGAGAVRTEEGVGFLRVESKDAARETTANERIPIPERLRGQVVTLYAHVRASDIAEASPPQDAAKFLLRQEAGGLRVLSYGVIHPPTDGQWHTVRWTQKLDDAIESLRVDMGLFKCVGRVDVQAMALFEGEAAAPDWEKLAVTSSLPEGVDADFVALLQKARTLDELDVTLLGADPTGKTDATAPIQAAFIEARRRSDSFGFADKEVIPVLFPAGTFRVSGSLHFGEGRPQHLHVVGAGVDLTEIILADESPLFGDAEQPRPVISFTPLNVRGWASNVSFNNAVRDITVTVGAGNPGAVGLDFHNNNTGSIRNLRIRSADPAGAGHTGLRMPGGLSGIGLLEDIEIDGFAVGIEARDRKIGYAFDRLTLRGQTRYGIVSNAKPMWIRRLVSDNRVPAIRAEGASAHIVLLDSQLRGGDAASVAIESRGAPLHIRNCLVEGYAAAIDVGEKRIDGPRVDTFLWPDAQALGKATWGRSLQMEDAPEVAEPDTWVEIPDNASGADLQAAIDGGATGIRLLGRVNLQTPLVVRGQLRVLQGATAVGIGAHNSTVGFRKADDFPQDQPLVRIVPDAAPLLLMDSISSVSHPVVLENRSEGTVVIQDSALAPYRGEGTGRVFFERLVPGYGTGAFEMVFHPVVVVRGQRAWFRHFNPEGAFPHLVNDGGEVVVFGGKFGEYHGPYVITANRGRTEILGVLLNSISQRPVPGRAMVVADGGSMSVTAADDQIRDRSPHPWAMRAFGKDGEVGLRYSDLPSVNGPRAVMSGVSFENDLPDLAPDAPTVTVVQDAAPLAEPGMVRFRVVVEPAPTEPLRVRLASDWNATVEAEVAGELPVVEVPAGTGSVDVDLPVASLPEGVELLTVRAVAGDGYRSNPIAPPAHVHLLGTSTDLDAGLEFHLSVPEEASAPVDVSGRNQRMQMQDVAVTEVDGRTAMRFARGSRIRLGGGGTVVDGYDRSFMQSPFEARTFALSVHADGNAGNLIRQGGGFGGMELNLTDGQLRFTTSTGNVDRTEISAPWPNEERWRHVAAVYHHGGMFLYVDGELVAHGRGPSYQIARHSREGGIAMDPFEGHLDDVRIYERALTGVEIQKQSAR